MAEIYDGDDEFWRVVNKLLLTAHLSLKVLSMVIVILAMSLVLLYLGYVEMQSRLIQMEKMLESVLKKCPDENHVMLMSDGAETWLGRSAWKRYTHEGEGHTRAAPFVRGRSGKSYAQRLIRSIEDLRRADTENCEMKSTLNPPTRLMYSFEHGYHGPRCEERVIHKAPDLTRAVTSQNEQPCIEIKHHADNDLDEFGDL